MGFSVVFIVFDFSIDLNNKMGRLVRFGRNKNGSILDFPKSGWTLGQISIEIVRNRSTTEIFCKIESYGKL